MFFDTEKISAALLCRDEVQLFPKTPGKIPTGVAGQIIKLAEFWQNYEHADYGNIFDEMRVNLNRRKALVELACAVYFCGENRFIPAKEKNHAEA